MPLLHAQGPRVEQRFVVLHRPAIQDTTFVDRVPTGNLAMAGALGLIAGFVGGAYLGAKLFEANCVEDNRDFPEACEWSGLGGGIVGGMAGASIVIPASIHLANHGKGNLPVELLVSAGLGVLGTAAIFGSEGSGGLLLGLVGVPIAQIVFTVHQERAAEYSGR